MTKILLVEDNEMNRDMLSRRLQKQGYERERQAVPIFECNAGVLGDPGAVGILS
jgi:CheY-like chemotaxis protein